EKAKSLFHDMMQQAAYEFGFEAEDIPLMIEAIPASSDSIVLIITKVEDPDELDTRFSKFAPSPSDESGQKKQETPDKLEGAETLLNLLGKVKEKMEAVKQAAASENQPAKEEKTITLRLFSFAAMEHVLQAAQLLNGMYHGSNTLYKDTAENLYILAIMQSDHSINDFNRICNMLTEFGTLEKSSGASLAFLEEHCEALVSNDAIQQLSAI
ncbi:MAG: adaptor protein MecA, partial [Dorea sp.]|nr:adaptor protein MecA [Dorea sp.]